MPSCVRCEAEVLGHWALRGDAAVLEEGLHLETEGFVVLVDGGTAASGRRASPASSKVEALLAKMTARSAQSGQSRTSKVTF
jgi:hypothetical protein